MTRIAILLGLALAASAGWAQEAIEVDPEPRVRVETNVGDFVIQLNRLRAPLTVDNFLALVGSGHYSGTIFHRVVGGFVAQAGGYTADLQAKPIDDTVFNESGNGLGNIRGSVGMARTADPHSATNQFYINLADNSQILDPLPTRWGYAVFGEVIEGMDVVDSIGHSPTGPGGEFDRDVPMDTIVINDIVRLTE